MNRHFEGQNVVSRTLVCFMLVWCFTHQATYAYQGPLSPHESHKQIRMQSNFVIELVASEPQVVDPVSMNFDEHGRMWVVEMRDYPVEDDMPKSRVVILEDQNHDGIFETSHVFADKLRYATGVLPWRDGAIVTVHGELLFLRDTDGDGAAEQTTVWLDGFSTGNPQLRANHPMIGWDGCLYVASGLRGGKVVSRLTQHDHQNPIVDLAGSDLKLNLLTGKAEAISGPSQFGLSFDRLGHRYGVSNRQPCFEIVSEREDLGLSPLSGLQNATSEVSPGEAASRVFPIVKAWTTSNLHAGQFTAACGMIVTHSPHFGEDPFATVLTCEPTGGLVQRRAVQRAYGRSKVSDAIHAPEWLASSDPWFRPVDLYEGPHGDIYVVDMYRAVIEHPEWVPAELKKRPDERFGDAHGRIYRISSPNASHHSDRRITPFNILEWIDSPHSWNRSIAIRKFMEVLQTEEGPAWAAAIRQHALAKARSSGEQSVANACLLLNTLGALDETMIRSLLQSNSSQHRALAWSCLRQSMRDWEGIWNEQFTRTIENSQADVDELLNAAWFVAKQASLRGTLESAQTLLSRQLLNAVAQAWLSHADDLHLAMALSAACKPKLVELLLAFAERPDALEVAVRSKNAKQAVVKLASYVATHSTLDTIKPLMDNLITEERKATKFPNGLTLLLEGIIRSGKVPIEQGSEIEGLVLNGIEASQDIEVRQSCIAMLGYCQSSTAKRTGLRLLDNPDSRLLKPAIAACSQQDSTDFTAWLFEQLPSALPEIRQDIFAAIRSHPSRIAALIERLEIGTISPKMLDAAQIQSLKSIKTADLASRINKIFAASVNPNRQRVIDDYSKKIREIHVDPTNNRGKAIFVKNCAACHRLDDVGNAVGPDISDSRVQTFENLLISVLDPNRTIDANYFRFIALTKDGRTIEGILKDANAQTVTLQNQNGSVIVERSEIEEFKSSGISLMPEGIEAQLPADEMAEMLWFIKNWRYSVDKVPANATIPK